MAQGGRLPDNLNEHSTCGALNIPDLRPQIHNVHTDSILGVVPARSVAFLSLSHSVLGRVGTSGTLRNTFIYRAFFYFMIISLI